MKSIRRLIVVGLVITALLVTSTGVVAQTEKPLNGSHPAAQSLDTILTPNGTLNIPAGFSGNLDTSGWNLASGPGGEPRFTRAGTPQLNEIAKLAPGDDLWDPQFMLGANSSAGPGYSSVYAMAVSGNNVFIGGDFDYVGNVAASHVAKWDNAAHQWSALGSGVNNRVSAIAANGNDVYVGGYFTSAGGISVSSIAHWNDSSHNWLTMGGALTITGYSPQVSAIAIGSGSNVYVGGSFEKAGGFTVNNIARWDGSNWYAMSGGTGGTSPDVYAIAVSGSDVYVGGSFTTAGGFTRNGIAHWNGSAWSSMGSGVGGFYPEVDAIAISGGNVYIGGRFTTVTDNAVHPVGHVAVWNGVAWNTMGGGVGDPDVAALTIGPDGVYVGGRFTTLADGSTSAKRLARWDGANWHSVGGGGGLLIGNDGVDSNVYALAVMGNAIYVSGPMVKSSSGRLLNNIGYWDNTDGDWYALGNSVNGAVNALAIRGDDVYLGGVFSSAGGVKTARIARWNQHTHMWSDVGGGVSGCTGSILIVCDPVVYAIRVDGNNVYVGGNFTHAGGVATSGVARWDAIAQTWHALGNGVSCSGGGLLGCAAYVRALAVTGGYVYAGGQFDHVTNTGPISLAANNLAVWNGSGWGAISNGTNGVVYAIEALSTSSVQIGGNFNSPANYIVKWNGSSWSVIGNELADTVRAMDWMSRTLSIGGAFINAGIDTAADHIAVANGAAWGHLGSGLDDEVDSLHWTGESLYAGGTFMSSGITGMAHVARWHGNIWSGLGSGTDDTVLAIAHSGNSVYVGGLFENAGGKPSAYFGRWLAPEYIYLPLIRR